MYTNTHRIPDRHDDSLSLSACLCLYLSTNYFFPCPSLPSYNLVTYSTNNTSLMLTKSSQNCVEEGDGPCKCSGFELFHILLELYRVVYVSQDDSIKITHA